MILQYWWSLLVQQIRETDWIVWVSVVFSIAEVLFAKANKIWLYPTGIIGTLLGMYILFVVGLYAECLLSVYYVVMSVYGWWYWIKKKDYPPVKITYCTKEEWGQIVVFTLGGFPLLFYKHLALYSVLTIFLFIVAIQGYIEWRKIIKNNSLEKDNLEPSIG